MRKALILCILLVLTIPAFADILSLTGTAAGVTVWKVTATAPLTGSSEISSATISIATAELVSVQVVCVSPTVQTEGKMDDLIITPKVSLAGLNVASGEAREFLTAQNCWVSPSGTEYPREKYIKELGLHYLDMEFNPRVIQFVFNFKAISTSAVFQGETAQARGEYLIYIRVHGASDL